MVKRFVPLLLLLSACASSPAPAPASAPSARPAAAPAEPEPRRVSLVCHEAATALRFDEMGIPQGERPKAVAVHGDETYVLFEPGRLARITRKDGKAQLQMSLAPPGQAWTAMAVDPTDGSVWVSNDRFALVRFDRDWNNQVVKIKRVEGNGGFQALEAMADALYAEPFCAEDGIWRLDRKGNILSSAFPVPPLKPADDQPMRVEELGVRCSPVRMERDPEGQIVVWDYARQTLHRLDAQGSWTEVPPTFFATLQAPSADAATVVKGADLGGAQEQWYLKGSAQELFYWKSRPVFFGGFTSQSRGTGQNTVLLLPRADASGFDELIESCFGLGILAVGTDGSRYAAVTDKVVVFGDFATAPDLP
jgi:streptogramin lyase